MGALAPLARFSPAWRMWSASVRFDARAARGLFAADHLIAFNGTALAQFRAAPHAGLSTRSLVSANSHMRRVVRQHELAYRQYPVERPWATHLVRRNLSEYAHADRIYVASRYVRESFTEEGFGEERLSLFPLTPDARYEPAGTPSRSNTFDIVYCGSLLVHKGVPLLLDAVRRLGHEDLRLILVGGWKTRAMRRFIQGACRDDPRVSVRPGDALPWFRSARLCVHPAYEDGFAYAPAEAMACGVPVIVSEDTGMKELIDPGRDGVIVPTGSVDSLAQAIDASYRGEILHA
jgi:glycosyltransferase involved in cell wall biosynthesis